jgi:hypothetical protein
MKGVKMCGACGSCAHFGGKEKYIQGCGMENLGERDHLEDVDINREYYKMDLKDMVGGCVVCSSGPQQGQVVGCCEYGNEPSGSKFRVI